MLGSTRQDEAQATQHFTDLESSDTGAQQLPGLPVPLETRSRRSATRMTPHFSRQSRPRDTFVPDCLRNRWIRGCASGKVPQLRPGSPRSRWLTAEVSRPRCSGAAVLEPDRRRRRLFDEGRTGRRGCVGLKESGDETLAMTTAHQPTCRSLAVRLRRPRTILSEGDPGAVQRRDLLGGRLQKRQVFNTFSAGAHSRRRSSLIRSVGVPLDPAAPLLLVQGGRAHAGRADRPSWP